MFDLDSLYDIIANECSMPAPCSLTRMRVLHEPGYTRPVNLKIYILWLVPGVENVSILLPYEKKMGCERL